jgi:hypothetical protein
MIRQVLIKGPWHDLQKIPVEGLCYATGIRRPGTGRMQVLEILPRPKDFKKGRKIITTFWQSGFVGRQIPGDDVRGTNTWRRH